VIENFFPKTWAVPALMAGIALFFAGCQPTPPPSSTVEAVRPDPLAVAETYYDKGELAQALVAYQAYLRDAPKNERTALAIQRTSHIYLKRNQPARALTALERLCREYPDVAWIPGVRYQMANVLSLIGEHSRSAAEALAWLERYPHHPLKKDVYLLLGEDFSALGDKAEAFHWWLRAEPLWEGDPAQRARLEEKLNQLISTSGPVLLQQFAVDAAGTPYAPRIYDRIVAIHLEQRESDAAEKAAKSLIQSTEDGAWISKGNAVLKRLHEERAVKEGVVGCLLPLSGPFSLYGSEVLKGLQLGMYLDGVQPGVPPLELRIKDTEGNPEQAAAAVHVLAEKDKVMAVIGPLSSQAAGVAAETAQKIGVPMIALSQQERLVETGDIIFRNLLTPAREIKGLLKAAVGRMGLKRFAILYPENSYGSYCMNTFWDQLEQMGGEVTAVESYGLDDTDFADQIKKMVALYYPRPPSLIKKIEAMRTPEDEEDIIYPEKDMPFIDFDAVFVPDSFQRVAMIAPQLVFHDVLDVQLLGTSGWQSPQLIEMAKDYVQGAVFCSGFFPDAGGPKVRAFVDAYRENFDAEPGVLAANGFDTIRLLKQVLSDGSVRTRSDLAKALAGLEGYAGVSGTTRFDDQGEALKEPILLTISGNKMLPLFLNLHAPVH